MITKRRLRLGSGLILFVFVLTHLTNHALGLISLEAMEAGQHYGGYTMTDAVLIENLHPQVMPAIQGATPVPEITSVGILETFASPACIVAADAACKAANVTMIEIRLANGLGGKAFFTLTGELHDVEAAIEGAVAAVESGLLLRTEIIAAPHEQVKPTLY